MLINDVPGQSSVVMDTNHKDTGVNVHATVMDVTWTRTDGLGIRPIGRRHSMRHTQMKTEISKAHPKFENPVSKYWEVLARRKYTENFGFLVCRS